MISYHRIKQVALVALGAILVYAIGMMLYLHHARAAGDPVVVATTATDAGWELFQAYGWLWGGAGLAYALSQRLLALNANTHWLAQGRILAALTGAVTVLGTVIQWRFQGAPAAGIVAALAGAIALVWHPVVRPALPRIGITALALLTLGTSQLSCTAAKSEVIAAGHAIIDCVKAEAAPIEALLVELVADALSSALHAGAVDWQALASKAEAQGATTGGCAFALLVHGQAPATSTARSLVAMPDPASSALERLRSRLGGVQWQTASGTP